MSHLGRVGLAATIATMLSAPHAFANLVADPGFELNNGSWTTDPNNWWFISHTGRGIHTGSNAIHTGCPDSSCLSFAIFFQDLATTPGQTYDISFWLYTDGLFPNILSTPNGLQVSWGGVVVDTIQDFPTTNPSDTDRLPGGPSTLITVDGVVAPGSLTRLQFAGYHGPATIFVDDVSVNAVPEPASIFLLGLGLTGVALKRRRQL